MEERQYNTVNRQYKDRLFKLIFREKEDLLQLYNAINNTNYDNPEDVEVNTLTDVVYMGMKNDISFLITDVLNLYEHQSTFNPNLPLRGMLYFANLYRKIIGNRKDLYSGKIIELPYPQFIVFYNGTREEPERQELRLSDAFPEWSKKENAALECKAVVLNINLGYNKAIMERCKKLREYAQFIEKVRGYLGKGYEIEEAINQAIEECIAQGILEEILRSHREEVFSMLLTEYDEQAHIENEKEISFEEGRREGIIEGRKEGIIEGRLQGKIEGKEEGEKRFARLIQNLIQEERVSEIEKATNDEEYRETLYKEFRIL